MKLFASIIFTFLLCIFAACSSSSTNYLDSVEDVIEIYPDSALTMLNAHDDFTSDRDQARYALLYTQALYKTYQQIDNDSLISIAVNFFRKSGDDLRLMKALYYKATIKTSFGDILNGIILCLDGLDIASRLNDSYYLAKYYELLAALSNASYNANGEIEYSRLAANSYREAGRIDNYYSLLDNAVAYANNKDPEKSICLLDSILQLSGINDDIRLYGIRSKVCSLIQLDRLEDIDRLIECGEYCADTLDITDCLNMFDLCIRKDKLDKAQYWIDKANYIDSTYISSIKANSIIKERQHDYLAALQMYKRFVAAEDSIVGISIRQILPNAISNHSLSLANKKEQVANTYKLYTLVLFFLLVLIVIAYYLYYREHIKRKNIEIEQKIDAIQELSTQVRYLNCKNREMSSKISSIFKDKFTTINSLCDDYYEKQGLREEQLLKSVYNTVIENLKTISSNTYYITIERIVNECMDGIIGELRNEVGDNLSNDDIKFITYIYAGFSAKSVCVIMNLQKSNFYAKRKRLKLKIDKLNLPHGDKFAKYLS